MNRDKIGTQICSVHQHSIDVYSMHMSVCVWACAADVMTS